MIVSEDDFLLGDFRISPRAGGLRPWPDSAKADLTRLTPKQMDLLLFLARNAGQVISKERLFEEIWPDVTVGEANITSAIYELRQALDDSSAQPRYIRTAPRRGYQLIADVRPLPVGDDLLPDLQVQAPKEPANLRHGKRRVWWLPLGAMALALASFAIVDYFGSYSVSLERFENRSPDPSLDDFAATIGDALKQRADEIQEPTFYRFREHSYLTARKVEGEVHRSEHGILLRAFLRNKRTGQTEKVEVEGRLEQHDQLIDKLFQALRRELDVQVCTAAIRRQDLQASHCFRAGERLVGERRYDLAIPLIERAITLWGSDTHLAENATTSLIKAYDRLANTHDILGDTPGAQAAIAAAIALLPKIANRRLELDLRRRHAQIDGNIEAERAIYQELLDLEPQDTELKFRYSWFVNTHDRDCRRSQDHLVDAMREGSGRSDDHNAVYHSYSGVAFLLCGNLGEALKAFKRYVELRPDSPDSHDSLATAYLKSGDYLEARRELNKALALDPDYTPSLLQKGDLEFEIGAYSEARRAYVHYGEVAGSWPHPQSQTQTRLAATALAAGDLSAALDHAQRAVNLRPTSIPALWQLGIVQLQRGDLSVAAELADRIEMLRAPFGSRYQLEYFHHLEGGIAAARDSEAALGALEKALTLWPSDFLFFRLSLAETAQKLGRIDRAILAYQELLAINPNHPRANCRLGLIFRARGDQAQALLHLEKAVVVYGQNPEDELARTCLAEWRGEQRADPELN